jgi:hypothetical protein
MRAAKATLLVFIMSAAFAFAVQGQSDWIKYDSPEGRYTALFPAKPQPSTQETKTKTGESLTQYFASCSDPDTTADLTYMIAYFDAGPAMTFSFDEARDGFVAAVHGTLISEKPIRLGAYEGREFRASTKTQDGQEYGFIVRIILVEKRIYVNQFIFGKSSESPRAFEKGARFLDSFQVKNAR